MLVEVQGTSAIFAKVARARRRLRMQSAFEALARVSFVAFAVCAAMLLVVLTAWALGALFQSPAMIAASASVAGFLTRGDVVAFAAAGFALLLAIAGSVAYFRRLSTAEVATRIDRASGLSDRLASACQFSEILDTTESPETAALMRAAIRDAERALPRADEKRAAPLSWPRSTWLSVALAGAVVIAAFVLPEPPTEDSAGLPTLSVVDPTRPLEDAVILDEDDRAYAEQLVEELRKTAAETGDEQLKQFAAEVEALLDKAARGEITKAELLEALARAEKKYLETEPERTRETLASLSATGEQLQKTPLTRKLGKALERGDLKKAKAELEKLAEKLETGDLSKEQKEKLADALEKAAKAFEKREEKERKAADEKIAKKKEAIRRLERKIENTQSEEKKRRLTRKRDEKKRELQRLEREKQKRQASSEKRRLERIHRNLRDASEAMRQQNRKLAQRKLRDAADKTGDIQQEIRRLAKQGQTRTKMRDLREAMRRAKQRRRSRGPRDLFGKNKKNEDFKRRAAGGQGSRKVWRPGSKEERLARTRPGNGQKPGQQGQGQKPGQKQPGNQAGDGHDPNLMDDPTKNMGPNENVEVSGVHGRGPSRRETILSAAEKGFSSRSYEKVYADYRAIVEEVIKAESVPAGYKYYVKKYFQKIKPHN